MILIVSACRPSKTRSDNYQDSLDIKSGISTDFYTEKTDQNTGNLQESILLRKEFFQNTTFITTNTLEDFQKNILVTLVKNGDGEFETDSTYVIEFTHIYVIDSDTIFYIKGRFIPSSVDFHFYGGHNKKDQYNNIYHLPLETSFNFTKYEVYDQFIRVYGEMRDNNSEDEGEVLLFQLSR